MRETALASRWSFSRYTALFNPSLSRCRLRMHLVTFAPTLISSSAVWLPFHYSRGEIFGDFSLKFHHLLVIFHTVSDEIAMAKS